MLFQNNHLLRKIWTLNLQGSYFLLLAHDLYKIEQYEKSDIMFIKHRNKMLLITINNSIHKNMLQ